MDPIRLTLPHDAPPARGVPGHRAGPDFPPGRRGAAHEPAGAVAAHQGAGTGAGHPPVRSARAERRAHRRRATARGARSPRLRHADQRTGGDRRAPGAQTERALEQAAVRYRAAMELDHTEAIKQAVIAGLGVAFVSVHAVRGEVSTGRLRALRLRGLRIRRHFHVIHNEARRLSPGARAFMELLEEAGRSRRRSPAPPGWGRRAITKIYAGGI